MLDDKLNELSKIFEETLEARLDYVISVQKQQGKVIEWRLGDFNIIPSLNAGVIFTPQVVFTYINYIVPNQMKVSEVIDDMKSMMYTLNSNGFKVNGIVGFSGQDRSRPYLSFEITTSAPNG